MASGIAALEAQLARGDVGGARAVASAMLERGGLEAGEQVAVLRLRARAAELLRDPASGMEDLDAALALSPGDASLWDELGFLSMQAGRASRAVAAFRQSTTLVPGNARAWNNLGNACSALGEAGDAIAAFREAVAHNPDYALAWANLGLALSDIGARADAEIALLRALSIDPMQLTALTALGAIRRQLGRIDEAVALYARAAKHAPDDPNPALQLAFALV